MADAKLSRIVVGTAGHVDHGKTALVRALTGVDTDRLKEEKERGITIELGFASMELPGSRSVAIVDVPGHEKFVHNMVAGASGIDFVLFVIAGDEGVMPQTREHLDICNLLGVKGGIVALTKADLVEPEFLDLVREEVSELLKGTFLENAPLVPVSSVTGLGIEDLKGHISRLAAAMGPRDAKGLFRLPVDRVFTIKGFGTVLTGTALSGSVAREDDLELLPSGARAKVRGIEVHGEKVEKGYAGNRLALNLTGLEVGAVSRGETAVHPGTISATRMADALFSFLPSAQKPLELRGRFRLHVNTREVPAVVALLDRERLLPGQSALVQIRSAEHFTVCPGDHFVIRGYSPVVTLGGGRILDSKPRRHKGLKEQVVRTLGALESGSPLERLKAFLELRGALGMTPQETQVMIGSTIEEARNLLSAVVREKEALVVDRKPQRHVYLPVIRGVAGKARGLLENFHRAEPLRKGMGLEELRQKLPSHLDSKLIGFTLDSMVEEGVVVFEGEKIRLATFKAVLKPDDEGLRNRLIEFVAKGGFEAPTSADAANALNEEQGALKKVMDFMVQEGLFVRTKEGFYLEAGLMAGLVAKVIDRLQENGEMSVADLKEMTKVSRKYVIPLMEYLDSNKITTRLGEKRVAGPKGKKLDH